MCSSQIKNLILYKMMNIFSQKKRKLPAAFQEFQKAKKAAIESGASSFSLNGKTYKRSKKSIGGVPVFKRSSKKSASKSKKGRKGKKGTKNNRKRNPHHDDMQPGRCHISFQSLFSGAERPRLGHLACFVLGPFLVVEGGMKVRLYVLYMSSNHHVLLQRK